MNVVLKGFSQDVDLQHPEKVNHVLVFSMDGKTELRLPVQSETVNKLIEAVYVQNAASSQEPTVDYSKQAHVEEDEDLKDAAVFGGGDEPEEEPEESGYGTEFEDHQDEMPMSEDEVPSL